MAALRHSSRMTSQPRGDTATWNVVLAHRPDETRGEVAARLAGCGLTPTQVAAALIDAGDALHATSITDDPAWTDRFSGPLAVALLSAEVSALAAHLTSRASAVRVRAVEALLEDFSAVSVAAHLGVSRQKVYDIARSQRSGPFITHTPWSMK